MKVRVRITPKHALALGVDIAGLHVIDIDPAEFTEEQRKILASRMDEEGNINAAYSGTLRAPTAEALKAWLEELEAEELQKREEQRKRAEEQEAREAKQEEEDIALEKAALDLYFAHPNRLLGLRHRDWGKGSYGIAFVNNSLRELTVMDHGAYILWLYRSSPDQEAKLAEDWLHKLKLEKDADAAKEAEKEARAKAKDEYLATWVRERGSESMRERQAENLLPRQEAIKALAASVLDPFGPVFEYSICENRSCECREEDIDTLSEEAFLQWREIRDDLPEFSRHRFLAVYPCPGDDDDVMIQRLPLRHEAVEIQVPAGPFMFKRVVELA
jgi:hypothetical protein